MNMNIKRKLNNFYNKVIDDVANNRVDAYTKEIAEKYNALILSHKKYQSRMLLILK